MKILKSNLELKLKNQETINCNVLIGRYGDNKIALQCVSNDGEILITPTACMQETYNTHCWPDNVTAIRDYSEYEGCLDSLIEAGIVVPTGRVLSAGYTTVTLVKVIGV